MTAYYNENNPAAAHCLRALIADGIIAPGDVDDRSITEVRSSELKEYTQCHFFAGGGLWSAAARLAGWDDSRSLWTGSCPCQPFSVAGQGKGADDPRHLWPHFYRLIRERRPVIAVGEQVSKKAGLNWLDGVCDDLESEGYTPGAASIAASAVDSPQIRERLWWFGLLEGSECAERRATSSETRRQITRSASGGQEKAGDRSKHSSNVGNCKNNQRWLSERFERQCDSESIGPDGPEQTASHWGDTWIECYDEKARRTQPGVRFLVNGIQLPVAIDGNPGIAEFQKGRIEAWQIAGNAIVPQLAAEVLRSLM